MIKIKKISGTGNVKVNSNAVSGTSSKAIKPVIQDPFFEAWRRYNSFNIIARLERAERLLKATTQEERDRAESRYEKHKKRAQEEYDAKLKQLGK